MVVAASVRRRNVVRVSRVGHALLLSALLVVTADRAASAGPGPLLARLTRVEASPSSRSETIVDRFDAIGAESSDETRSLAADVDVAALADALDSAGVDVAAFSTDVSRFHDDRGTLLPYRAVAVGTGTRASGTYLALAFAQSDRASAVAQRQRLDDLLRTGVALQARRPWSDLLHVERLEVRGRVVLAILPTTVTTLWLDLERSPDTLLWWS